MSYYMGDYYRGDPGFLSFLGGIGKAALGFVPGVGPALQSGVEALTRRAAPAAAGAAAVSVAKPGFFKGAITKVGQGVLKHPVLSGAGAAGLVGAAAGAGAEKLLGGRRHCKHTYINKDGETKCRRRMRVTNPKALRRAIRRTSGFAKLAMRTIHIVHPRKKGRFGGFKRKRK